jgi:hypothetical protein
MYPISLGFTKRYCVTEIKRRGINKQANTDTSNWSIFLTKHLYHQNIIITREPAVFVCINTA